MTEFKVHVNGADVSNRSRVYSRLSDAVEDIERSASDDHTGWQFNDGWLRLVDTTDDKGEVIFEITPVDRD